LTRYGKDDPKEVIPAPEDSGLVQWRLALARQGCPDQERSNENTEPFVNFTASQDSDPVRLYAGGTAHRVRIGIDRSACPGVAGRQSPATPGSAVALDWLSLRTRRYVPTPGTTHDQAAPSRRANIGAVAVELTAPTSRTSTAPPTAHGWNRILAYPASARANAGSVGDNKGVTSKTRKAGQ